MKTPFRLRKSDDIQASLYTASGKLLTTLYDSGFSNLDSVYNALMRKCCNPPRGTKFSVTIEDRGLWWSNRTN